jgi:hypothetical protein
MIKGLSPNPTDLCAKRNHSLASERRAYSGPLCARANIFGSIRSASDRPAC